MCVRMLHDSKFTNMYMQVQGRYYVCVSHAQCYVIYFVVYWR